MVYSNPKKGKTWQNATKIVVILKQKRIIWGGRLYAMMDVICFHHVLPRIHHAPEALEGSCLSHHRHHDQVGLRTPGCPVVRVFLPGDILYILCLCPNIPCFLKK
jgi:hypothetical protein